jgi:hypothetical protein
MTGAILRQVCDLGYIVSFHATGEALELSTVALRTGVTQCVTIDEQGERGLSSRRASWRTR